MSTAQEIEAAIRRLPAAERAKLVSALPSLLPELDGDAAWTRIAEDPNPRARFSAMVNEIEAEYRRPPRAPGQYV
jgi:hypothetical protein